MHLLLAFQDPIRVNRTVQTHLHFVTPLSGITNIFLVNTQLYLQAAAVMYRANRWIVETGTDLIHFSRHPSGSARSRVEHLILQPGFLRRGSGQGLAAARHTRSLARCIGRFPRLRTITFPLHWRPRAQVFENVLEALVDTNLHVNIILARPNSWQLPDAAGGVDYRAVNTLFQQMAVANGLNPLPQNPVRQLYTNMRNNRLSLRVAFHDQVVRARIMRRQAHNREVIAEASRREVARMREEARQEAAREAKRQAAASSAERREMERAEARRAAREAAVQDEAGREAALRNPVAYEASIRTEIVDRTTRFIHDIASNADLDHWTRQIRRLQRRIQNAEEDVRTLSEVQTYLQGAATHQRTLINNTNLSNRIRRALNAINDEWERDIYALCSRALALLNIAPDPPSPHSLFSSLPSDPRPLVSPPRPSSSSGWPQAGLQERAAILRSLVVYRHPIWAVQESEEYDNTLSEDFMTSQPSAYRMNILLTDRATFLQGVNIFYEENRFIASSVEDINRLHSTRILFRPLIHFGTNLPRSDLLHYNPLGYVRHFILLLGVLGGTHFRRPSENVMDDADHWDDLIGALQQYTNLQTITVALPLYIRAEKVEAPLRAIGSMIPGLAIYIQRPSMWQLDDRGTHAAVVDLFRQAAGRGPRYEPVNRQSLAGLRCPRQGMRIAFNDQQVLRRIRAQQRPYPRILFYRRRTAAFTRTVALRNGQNIRLAPNALDTILSDIQNWVQAFAGTNREFREEIRGRAQDLRNVANGSDLADPIPAVITATVDRWEQDMLAIFAGL